MKKIITAVLLAAALLAGVSAPASAEDLIPYYISQKQISVAIPGNYEVITMDTEESPVFSREEIASIKENLKQANNYIDAVVPDFTREITVNVADNVWPSLGVMTEEMFSSFFSMLEEEYGNNNASIFNYESVKDGNVRYVKVWAQFRAGFFPYYALQYGTIIDSQAIWISLLVFEGEITGADEALMEQIWAQSELSKHENTEGKSGDTEVTAGGYYTDPESGVCFMVPNGWEELPLSKERQYVRMKMSPSGASEKAGIMYLQMDAYGALPESTRTLLGIHSREDIDNLLDADLVESMLGAELTSLTEQEKNGTRYYTGKSVQTYEIAGNVPLFETETTAAVFLKNGYIMMFQFYDLSSNSGYLESFEAVTDSVSIPDQ